ncbi:GGDEF domain-containing protein [Deinococcus navajonensis]|uniref:Diguanylate cyclase domain-containing protein n=1 Tax=Deinococcus navajonensis TaxID=309884 RepID=A0ABV8XRR0_9DEIO
MDQRAVLLLILPLAALASLAAAVLDRRDPFDAAFYPLILVGVLLLYGALLWWPRASALVAGAVLWGFSAFFLIKLVYVLFFTASPQALASGLSGTFFWTPAVFLFTFTTANLRRGRAVNISFLAAMLLLSLVYVASEAVTGDPHLLNVLAQLNLANLTCFLLAGVIHRLAGRHAATAEYARTFERLAHTDVLTGLPNRRAFEQRVARAIAQTERQAPPAGLTVLYLDLNGFKQINDTYGHETGDLVLCRVAERLRGVFRSDEVVARLSGDEFAGLILSGDPDVVQAVVRRVELRVAEPISVPAGVLHVTASVGTSKAPAKGAEVQDLLRQADAAMYAVKRRARPDRGPDGQRR